MKKFTSKFVALLVLVLMICAMLPTAAFADLVTGETQTCKFQILYVDSSFNIGYNYGDSWNVDYTCQYTTGHSGYNHTIACSVIKDQVNKAETMVNDGYEVVGWSKTASSNPQVFTTYTGDTATQTSYTIYLVAKKTTPAPATYTVTYTDGVADEVIFEDQVYSNQTSGTATPAFQGTPEREGYTFKGWSPELAATVTANVTYTAVWEKNTTPVDPDPDEKTNEPGMEKTSDKTSVKPSETVNFTLTSNVPDYLGDYLNAEDPVDPGIAALSEVERGSYELTFHDKMDGAFAFNNDVAVTVNGKILDSSLYTVMTNTDDDCTFHVTMDLVAIYETGDYFTLEEIEESPEIVVTYSATLSDEAGAGTYTNQAWAGFEGRESEKPIVNVDVYGVDIFKYDQKTDEGLAGAEFELKDSEGTVIATLTSNEDGHAHYEGLAAGTYTIVETKAPDGYVKSDKPLTVVIPDNADATTNIADVQFANSEIPHTGGTGTMAYTIGGLAIIGIAAVGFVISRKKKTQAE